VPIVIIFLSVPYLLEVSVPFALLLCALAVSIGILLAWPPRQQHLGLFVNDSVLTCVSLCPCDSNATSSTVHYDCSRGHAIRAPCPFLQTPRGVITLLLK
jgi:hypothetical protein